MLLLLGSLLAPALPVQTSARRRSLRSTLGAPLPALLAARLPMVCSSPRKVDQFFHVFPLKVTSEKNANSTQMDKRDRKIFCAWLSDAPAVAWCSAAITSCSQFLVEPSALRRASISTSVGAAACRETAPFFFEPVRLLLGCSAGEDSAMGIAFFCTS